MTMKFISERVGEGTVAVSLAKRLLLGGTATLALVAAISAAPVNFERSLLGDFSGADAHADGGEGGGDGDGGGESGESGSDDSGERGSDDSGESGDDSATGGDDDGTPDQGSGDVPAGPAPVIVPTP